MKESLLESIHLKLGTHIKLPDGRTATVVFQGLTGCGIKWGTHNPKPEDFENTHGDCFTKEPELKPWPWTPDAMLREKEAQHVFDIPCVGEDFEII